jgi:hypothetical protein
MRANRPFTQLITFDSGFPDGDVEWTLVDTAGAAIASGAVTPAEGAVSAIITISGTHNTLTGGALADARELVWTYAVDGLIYFGEVRYTLEASVPFPVTPQGVRDKLGIELHELPDDAIGLMDAYLNYREAVAIDTLQTGTSRQQRMVANALEAIAALAVLPTLQLRVAMSEGSSTNTFSRYMKVDWESLRAHLAGYVSACSQELSAGAAAGTGLFIVAGAAVDPVTGV